MTVFFFRNTKKDIMLTKGDEDHLNITIISCFCEY